MTDQGVSPRAAAFAAAAEVTAEPTSLLDYRSQGRVLIIGPYQQALALFEQLPDELHNFVLATDAEKIEAEAESSPTLAFSNGNPIQLSGHLGEYSISVETEQGDVSVAQALLGKDQQFDLIVDLGEPPLLDLQVLPYGYFVPGNDSAKLEAVLAELPDMVGEFEKPKYFDYNPDICAHSSSGLTACTRCIDACPTGAISSLIEKITVDPYFCQGGGSCATACPTGAMTYRYPQPADTSNRLRALLRAYREAGGANPILLFHDSEAGQARVDALGELPDSIIPLAIAEIGSLGLDTWLVALAYGACQIVLVDTEEIADKVRQELREQLSYANALLTGMGYPSDTVTLLAAGEDVLSTIETGSKMPVIAPAGFAGSNDKRATMFFALDHLYKEAPQPQSSIDLPATAPFGEIEVNRETCTLCMACVSVCPAAALADGGDEPKLNFIEANCVQCGLCEMACPETAITRHARFVYDRETRMRQRTLNEEAPFHCIACGTPFATQSVIEKMLSKLSGHAMFQDDKALQRLKMCGDCRVRDMFADEV